MISRRVNVCNIQIDNVTIQEAIEYIDGLAQDRRPSFVVTPNVDHIVRYNKDIEFAEIYKKAHLVVADGMPLIWGAKFLGTPLKAKVSGSDLFPEACQLFEKNTRKIFFLGGRPKAAEGAKLKLLGKFPKLRIVGCYCPPIGFEKDAVELKKISQMIMDAGPDILFVGLGSPKQEKWIYDNYLSLNVPVSIGIGVTFEFIAGMVQRAPVWMQKVGFEWFWRLMMEPGRLWKRYLIDDLSFFRLILIQKIGWKS